MAAPAGSQLFQKHQFYSKTHIYQKVWFGGSSDARQNEADDGQPGATVVDGEQQQCRAGGPAGGGGDDPGTPQQGLHPGHRLPHEAERTQRDSADI